MGGMASPSIPPLLTRTRTRSTLPPVAFLDKVAATIDAGGHGAPPAADAAGARLYLAALATRHRLEGGDVPAARSGVREQKKALESLREPDATVAAAVHRTAALLAKVKLRREGNNTPGRLRARARAG